MSGSHERPDGPVPDLATSTGMPAVIHEAMPTTAAQIGDPYLEGHGACAGGGGACFLTPDQRRLVIDAFQKEVMMASKEYSTALTEVEFDQLIKKDEELPFWIGMMLDVIGTLATDGIALGWKYLQKASEPQMLEGLAFLHDLQNPAELTNSPSLKTLFQSVQSVSPDALKAVSKSGVSLAKTEIKHAPPDGDKAQTLDYIGRLQEAAAIEWEHQWQDPPGQANDGVLILLFHSFKARNGHTAPRYKIALQEKLTRYKASPVSRIGRERAFKGLRDPRAGSESRSDPMFVETDTAGMSLRDTKVVWIQFSDHLPPVLYYYKRDAPDHQNDYLNDHLEITPLGAEDEFHAAVPVENEFIETAIARHKEIWGGDPELMGPEVLYAFDINRYAPTGVDRVKNPPSAPPSDKVKVPAIVPDVVNQRLMTRGRP